MLDAQARLEDEDEEPDQIVAGTSPLPSVAPPGRSWEYRVDALAVSELADGAELAGRLNQAADEGWDLVEIVDAGERRLVVLRKPKPAQREQRRVGFAPRNNS